MQVDCTDQDVTNFLKNFLELGGMNKVEDSPDRIIRWSTDNNPITLSVDGKTMPLAIYGTRSAEVLIINPFAEGEAESIKNSWFYSSRCTVIACLIFKLIRYFLEVAAASNSRKKGEAEHVDMKTIKVIAPHVKEVDEKMLKEFDQLKKELSDVFKIYYNSSTKITECKSILLTPSQQKAFASIRVKSWPVFSGILLDVLGVSDLSELQYRSTTLGCPMLEGFANVYVNVFDKLKDYFLMVEDIKNMVGDIKLQIGTLQSHLKYLGAYKSISSWCRTATTVVQPQQGAVPNTQVPIAAMPWQSIPQQIPNMVPINPVAAPIPNQIPMGQMPMTSPMGYPSGNGMVSYLPAAGGMMPGMMPAMAPPTVVPGAVGVVPQGIPQVVGAASRSPFAKL